MTISAERMAMGHTASDEKVEEAFRVVVDGIAKELRQKVTRLESELVILEHKQNEAVRRANGARYGKKHTGSKQ